MKMPQDQPRRISRPSKMKEVAPAESDDRMERICWATTDSTSMLMRLNSSQQPHDTACTHTHNHTHRHPHTHTHTHTHTRTHTHTHTHMHTQTHTHTHTHMHHRHIQHTY